MPAIGQASYLGSQYKNYEREQTTCRALLNTTYLPGMLVQLSSLDLQDMADLKTVGLPGTGASQEMLYGIVAETWPGFSPGVYAIAASSLAAVRGTAGVAVIRKGPHPGVLIDNSGTGAVTITNGLPLVASRATAGYAQAVAAASAVGGSTVVANAMLPASGIGYSITAAALAQASQTDTIAGTPAVGDTLSVTIETPYSDGAPGVVQTTTWTTPPLTAAQAVSATTAAAALVAYLNAQSNFSTFFTATNVAGVVTITVNALGSLFHVNWGSGTTVYGAMDISLSGMIANTLTFAVAATGGSTATAGAANLAGGTGFKGYIPANVIAG